MFPHWNNSIEELCSNTPRGETLISVHRRVYPPLLLPFPFLPDLFPVLSTPFCISLPFFSGPSPNQVRDMQRRCISPSGSGPSPDVRRMILV